MQLKFKSFINIVASIPIVLIISIGMLPILVFAESTISKGYLSKTELAAGTIVTQSNDPEVVVPANASNIDNLLGVVSSSSAIAFSSNAGEAQVVSEGVATAFISDARGEIKVGDKITVGELSGVGVKMTSNGKALGVAQLSFNKNSPNAKIKTLLDISGKKHQVAIGQIPVAVKISDYNEMNESSFIPRPVQLFFNNLVKRDVTPQAILVAIILLLSGVVIAGFILFGATRGVMVSLGRNPLSKPGVTRAFVQAALVALGAIAVALGLAYLTLIFIL